jgi:hypothetical protein
MGNFFGCYKEIHNTSPLKAASKGKEPNKRHYSYDTIGTEMSSQQALQKRSILESGLQDERREKEPGYKLNKKALDLSSSKDSTMDLSNQNLHGINSSVLDHEDEEANRHKQEEIQKLRQRAAELIKRKSHHTSQPKQHKSQGMKSKGV